MIERKILLRVDAKNSIHIHIPYQYTKLEGCEEVTIHFYYNQTNYIVYSYHTIKMAIESLCYLLYKALNNELILPKDFTQDIGYLWNEDLHMTVLLVDAGKRNEIKRWAGGLYLLWESPLSNNAVWLYNDNGKILLEVTPTYKWHFLDPEEDEDYLSYEEFIKNYKPHFILELSKNTARQWLDKTKELLAIMKQNYEKYEKLAQESLHNESNKI